MQNERCSSQQNLTGANWSISGAPTVTAPLPVEAMMKLDEPHRRSVIALARTLVTAYGEAKA
jgi:hypothetical protein